jgi:hypothetical protein
MDALKSRIQARFDLRIAGFLGALSLLLYCLSNIAAASCARRYGHNVDCGAYEWLAVVLYFAPLTLIFAFAALALWRNWFLCRYIHWLAIAAVIAIPFMDWLFL